MAGEIHQPSSCRSGPPRTPGTYPLAASLWNPSGQIPAVDTTKGDSGIRNRPSSGDSTTGTSGSEVHASAVAAGHGGSGVLLGLLGDDGLGGEEQSRDGRRVLQRRAGHLGRVD